MLWLLRRWDSEIELIAAYVLIKASRFLQAACITAGVTLAPGLAVPRKGSARAPLRNYFTHVAASHKQEKCGRALRELIGEVWAAGLSTLIEQSLLNGRSLGSSHLQGRSFICCAKHAITLVCAAQ